jgi:hypothetical protein
MPVRVQLADLDDLASVIRVIPPGRIPDTQCLARPRRVRVRLPAIGLHRAHPLDYPLILVQLCQVVLRLRLHLSHRPPGRVPLADRLPEQPLLEQPLPTQLLYLPLQLIPMRLLLR